MRNIIALLLGAASAKEISLDLSVAPKLSKNELLPSSGLRRGAMSLQSSNDSQVISKNLRDYYDVQIFARIYIGSNQQAFDMIFDTGSNWLWVMSEHCTNCPPNARFDDEGSSTYESSRAVDYLYYGSGDVYGNVVTDQVCITPEFCAADFTFMDILGQDGLYSLSSSGIVGLSPNHFEEESDLFIEKMKMTGAIDQAVFSLSIGMDDVQSKITFGGYDLEKYATGEIQWHNIDYFSAYWEVNMVHLHFETGGDKQYLFPGRSLIVDSGTSFNLMPENDLNVLLEHFERSMGLQFEFDVVPYAGCTLDDSMQFPDMHFKIDQTYYTLPRESYVLYEDGVCALKLMSSTDMDIWILGLNFFENYYTVFDQENRRVGFAPSIHAEPRMSTISLVQEEETQKQNQKLLMFLGMFTVIAGSVVCYMKTKKKNSNDFTSIERRESNRLL